MPSLTRAYTMGVEAHDHGHQLGSNPYDPEAEMSAYEAWVDGWSAKDNWIEDRLFVRMGDAVGELIEKELL